MIARGVRDLAVGLCALCGFTAVVSLLIGALAGLPPLRAVSSGFVLVGSLVFVAGAFAGLRDPGRARRRGPPPASPGGLRDWDEALHLSAMLVGAGIVPGRRGHRPRPGVDAMTTAASAFEHGSRCEAARMRASFALDGELDDVGRLLLRGHLAVCADCAAFAAGMRSTQAELRHARLEPFACALPRGGSSDRAPCSAGCPARGSRRRCAVAVGATSFSLAQDPVGPHDDGTARPAVAAKRHPVIPFRLPIGQRSARDDFAPYGHPWPRLPGSRVAVCHARPGDPS